MDVVEKLMTILSEQTDGSKAMKACLSHRLRNNLEQTQENIDKMLVLLKQQNAKQILKSYEDIIQNKTLQPQQVIIDAKEDQIIQKYKDFLAKLEEERLALVQQQQEKQEKLAQLELQIKSQQPENND